MAWLDGVTHRLRTTWPLSWCMDHEEPLEEWPPSWPSLEKPSSYQQSKRVPSPRLDPGISRPILQTQHSHPWTSDDRRIISRASSQASLGLRRNISRRPTISGPSNFRRTGSFRDEPRSLHSLANESTPEVTIPPTAHIKPASRSNTMLSRTSTNFSIPRKPIGSIRRTTRIITSTTNDPGSDTSSLSSILPSRPNSIYQCAITALPGSTQDFLDLLDHREPSPKPPPPLNLRPPSTLPKTIHRNASDQNLRLRAHLEQRHEIETRLEHFTKTISQELDHVSPKIGYTDEEDATIRSTIEATLAQRRTLRVLLATKPPETYQPATNPPISKYSPHSPSHHQKSPSLPIPILPPLPTSSPFVDPTWAWPSGSSSSTSPPRPSKSLSPISPLSFPVKARPSSRYGSKQSLHGRNVSDSTVEECPSLASAWSTPESSPMRGGRPVHEWTMQGTGRTGNWGVVKEVAVTEWGVAF